jgi:hypothetical protein
VIGRGGSKPGTRTLDIGCGVGDTTRQIGHEPRVDAIAGERLELLGSPRLRLSHLGHVARRVPNRRHEFISSSAF